MIISASRRTDIPAFYSQWMLNRLKEGVVQFPYPKHPKRMGHVNVTPQNVDCIVFWTKNPAPMLKHLQEIDALGYRYYFTFTINAYGSKQEQHLPPVENRIDTFRRLSDALGALRVDWRFDPILIDAEHTVQQTIDRFGLLCEKLNGYTQRCIFNFIRQYPHLAQTYPDTTNSAVQQTTRGIAAVAASHHLPLFHCSGKQDLSAFGIQRACCIDAKKVEQITGYPIAAKKDAGQPAQCQCIQSVDIGMYDSCANGCTYCYATTSRASLQKRMQAHCPSSPILIGYPKGDELVTDRTQPSLRESQLRWF